MSFVKIKKILYFIFTISPKFDGEFIIYWALTHGFTHVTDKKEIKDNTFTTLISDMGQFYSITLYFKKGNKTVHKVTFYDSLKIIPFSVDETAKAFGLEISKLKIDYSKEREKGYILTEEEKEYIKNDVLIIAKALNIMFNDGLDRMTRASSALKNYKETINKSKFDKCFPNLELSLDEELRKSYKGGFTYLNPIYKEKDVGEGEVLDVNSLYPSCMRYELLPFGNPIYYEGKYEDDKIYPLYIQMITCSFEIKKDMIPTIQIKSNSLFFKGNEYLESSNNEIVSLILTNIDLELFLEHYNVYDLNYECGWKFKGMQGLFNDYIDKWIEIKNNATITDNKGQRTMAKLMLNSLYGKFATSLEAKSKNPYLGDDEIIHYTIGEKEEKKGLYLPIGSFITAYARRKTIETSQAIKTYSIEKYGIDKYIYSDTDSIHTLLSIEELKKFCDIDKVRLGAWKHEAHFTKARFVRQKCYLEEIYKKQKYHGKPIKLLINLQKKCKKHKNINKFNNFREMEITCAGMPKTCYSQVEWNKFKTGFTCSGKLTFKHVKGGVILVDTDYTIKEEKLFKKH